MKRVGDTKEVSGQSPNYLVAKFQDLVNWAVNSSVLNLPAPSRSHGAERHDPRLLGLIPRPR